MTEDEQRLLIHIIALSVLVVIAFTLRKIWIDRLRTKHPKVWILAGKPELFIRNYSNYIFKKIRVNPFYLKNCDPTTKAIGTLQRRIEILFYLYFPYVVLVEGFYKTTR